MAVHRPHHGQEVQQALGAERLRLGGRSAVGEGLRQGDVAQLTAIADIDVTQPAASVATFENDAQPPAGQGMEGMGYEQ